VAVNLSDVRDAPLDDDARPWGRAWESPRPPEGSSRPASDTPGDKHVAGRRIVAHLLDIAALLIVYLGAGFLVISVAPSSWLAGPDSTSVWVLGLTAVNWVIVQGLTGYSVGKAIVRIKVVKRDGAVPGLWAAFVRTLPLLIEQFGIVGIWAIFRHPDRQRFGDRWARTFVVRARRETLK
jgi:uncharacterized RDD family membrane protein YckC